MACPHSEVSCLNHYEYFRKYRCHHCGAVLLCKCEVELVKAFLPHQAGFAHEYGTGQRIPVNGSARVCAACCERPEEPHPRAEGHGAGGKVDRFYWREIFKTYCEEILVEFGAQFPFHDILEYEASKPENAQRLRQKARKHWQKQHREAPKYETKERTQAEFLKQVPLPVKDLKAPYCQIERGGQQIGRWRNPGGQLVSVEDLVAEWYRELHPAVLKCERRLITIWVATFFGVPIQDPNDPCSQLAVRHSTLGWTPENRNTPLITFRLPRDFGSMEYYERTADILDTWIAGVRTADNVIALFDVLLPKTELIRDYLWVADEDAVGLGRFALKVVPREIVAAALAWAIAHFWDRQPGWPDLLVSDGQDYFFAEVKSPHDRLSQAQMNWFSWAVMHAGIPCELVKVRRMRMPSAG